MFRWFLVIPEIFANARWAQNGVTAAGGNGKGSANNQLSEPHGLFVDDDETIVIADYKNHRIVQCKIGDANGQVVAGGPGEGYRLDQLCYPSDVLIDKETDSLVICERGRVVRRSRRNSIKQEEILTQDIAGGQLARNDPRYVYVSIAKGEVRRYQIGDKNGILVAGGNGIGAGFNQLNWPSYIFVDRQEAVYVSDYYNHRVMKWNKDSTEGIVVAGGQCEGGALTQLSHPTGLFVNTLGTLYVADGGNSRVMRWPKGAKQGTVIVGGNGIGKEETADFWTWSHLKSLLATFSYFRHTLSYFKLLFATSTVLLSTFLYFTRLLATLRHFRWLESTWRYFELLFSSFSILSLGLWVGYDVFRSDPWILRLPNRNVRGWVGYRIRSRPFLEQFRHWGVRTFLCQFDQYGRVTLSMTGEQRVEWKYERSKQAELVS